MQIPRVIYINCYEKEDNELFQLCKKKLPRGRKLEFLYECEIDETLFREKYHDFDFFLTNPNIQGVYETQTPLDFKFMTRIGSIAKLDSKNLHKRKRDGGKIIYLFEDFRTLFTYSQPYLVNFKMQHIYLAQLTYRENHIWGYFNLHQREFHYCLVHKGKDKKNYKQLIREELMRHPDFLNAADDAGKLFSIKVTNHTTNE